MLRKLTLGLILTVGLAACGDSSTGPSISGPGTGGPDEFEVQIFDLVTIDGMELPIPGPSVECENADHLGYADLMGADLTFETESEYSHVAYYRARCYDEQDNLARSWDYEETFDGTYEISGDVIIVQNDTGTLDGTYEGDRIYLDDSGWTLEYELRS